MTAVIGERFGYAEPVERQGLSSVVVHERQLLITQRVQNRQVNAFAKSPAKVNDRVQIHLALVGQIDSYPLTSQEARMASYLSAGADCGLALFARGQVGARGLELFAQGGCWRSVAH